jgi:hypothetical protein
MAAIRKRMNEKRRMAALRAESAQSGSGPSSQPVLVPNGESFPDVLASVKYLMEEGGEVGHGQGTAENPSHPSKEVENGGEACARQTAEKVRARFLVVKNGLWTPRSRILLRVIEISCFVWNHR